MNDESFVVVILLKRRDKNENTRSAHVVFFIELNAIPLHI
jgi:hypothetical protein